MSPLVQPLHILRKDARHLWPETLVSIALLVAFAWAEIQTWQPGDGTFNPAILAVGFLKFLIPVSWLVLTSRLVHDEELVGDRQFWITRPYTWYSLLASKLIYLVVFVGIPFLVMQAWLLHHAGLYPTLLVPALLKNLLYIAAIFILPLIAIAAVTATFVRYMLSVLGGVIYLFTVVAIAAYNWADTLDAPYIGYYLSGTLLVLPIVALLLQYWRRKTLIARLLLAVIPIVVLLFALLTPVNLLSDHRYPVANIGTVAFDGAPLPQPPGGRLFVFQHKVAIEIPAQVHLEGMTDNSFVQVQRYRVVLDGPGGYHYASDWSSDVDVFNASRTAYFVPFQLPEKVYNRIHTQSVAIHLDLGTQTFHAGTAYSIQTTEAPFPLPGHAACTVLVDDGSLNCRFPFTNPAFTMVSATVHSGNCLTPGPQTAQAFGSLQPTISTPFGFSPVELTKVPLSVGDSNVGLCPGALTTFTPTVAGSYGRMTLDIPAITLDTYARHIPVASTPAPGPAPNPQP
jgi:hypothetical protein